MTVVNGFAVQRGGGNWPILTETGIWEWGVSRTRLRDATAPVVVHVHGRAGAYLFLEPDDNPFYPIGPQFTAQDQRDGFRRLMDEQGVVALNPDFGGGDTWGNDLSLSILDGWVDWALAQTLSSATTRVAMVAESMGHLTAVNYALRHPTKVAGVYGYVPVCDLEYHYNDGAAGNEWFDGYFPNEINAAYGLPAGPPDANNGPWSDAAHQTLAAERDPLTRAGELAALGIPWHLHYNLDDVIVPPSTITPFATAAGATTSSSATGGHAWSIDLDHLAGFVADLDYGP